MITQDASRSERSDAPAFQQEAPNPLQSRLTARASGGRSDPTTYTEAACDGWWDTVILPDGDTETPTLPHALWLGPVAVIRPARHGRGDRTGRSNPGVQTNALHGEQRRAEHRRRPLADSWRQRDGLAPSSSQGLFNALATSLGAGEATLAKAAGHHDAARLTPPQ